jgi:hypothetical protein
VFLIRTPGQSGGKNGSSCNGHHPQVAPGAKGEDRGHGQHQGLEWREAPIAEEDAGGGQRKKEQNEIARRAERQRHHFSNAVQHTGLRAQLPGDFVDPGAVRIEAGCPDAGGQSQPKVARRRAFGIRLPPARQPGLNGRNAQYQQSIDELNMHVRPHREEKRQPQQLASPAHAPRVHQDVHLDGKKQNREQPRPRGAHPGEAKHDCDGQHRALGEVRLEPAGHVINGSRDQRHHGRGKNQQTFQIHPRVKLEQHQFEEPAVSLPGRTAGHAGEGIGVRKRMVLKNPLARPQMPPDVGIDDRFGGAAQADEREYRYQKSDQERARDLVRGL